MVLQQYRYEQILTHCCRIEQLYVQNYTAVCIELYSCMSYSCTIVYEYNYSV